MQRISFFLLLLSIFFVSCNSDGFEEHELGGNLIDNSTDVRLIDTFTINASTVILDSIPTSGYGNMIVGRYIDPYLGVVSANSYTKIGLGGSFKLEANDEPVFDSLILVTYYNQSYYGDTTKLQTVNIHKVLEEIELEDDGNLYNVSSFEIDPEPLGTKTFRPRPFRKEDDGSWYNLRIELDPEFGADLIQKAIDRDEILNGSAEWENFLQGIAFSPAEDNDAAILNFRTADTLNMRLYYHEKSSDNAGKVLYHDFPVGASSYMFTNFDTDRTGTLLENLVEQEFDIKSEDTNDLTFMQGGVGIMTKLEIPHLDELAKIGLSGSLLKAELVFYPAQSTYDEDIFRLPSTFNVFTSDDENNMLTALTNPLTGSLLSATYFEDVEYDEGSYFTFDITNYVNTILDTGIDDEESLLISIPSSTLSTSMERMVLTNDDKTDFEFKLKATYVIQK